MWFDPVQQALVCRSCGEPPAYVAENTAIDCPNCGAELTLITGSRQAKCEFCDGTFAMLHDREDCELTGDIPDNHKYIIPFAVDKESYQKGMITWLAGEKLAPPDIFDKIGIIRSDACYIPYYYCVANFNGHYTASIGYDRTETYVTMVRQRDSRGNFRNVPVTRTRVVTDWKPYSAPIRGKSANLCEASRSTQDLRHKTYSATPPRWQAGIENSSHGLHEPMNVQIDRKQPLTAENESKFTAGYKILPCEDHYSKVYDKEKIHRDIHNEISQTSPGDRIKDINFQGDIVPDYFLVYRPSWQTVYSYGEKICYATSDATDHRGAGRHYGTRPVDKEKKERLRRLRHWLFISLAVVSASFVGTILVAESDILPLFALVMILGLLSSAIAGVFNIHGYFTVVKAGRASNTAQSERYLATPSMIFERRSAKADPTI